MKTFISILLFGLLGFLGCSGSDDRNIELGSAIPVAPLGIIENPRPTYEWTPVPWATKYRLVVQDANQAPYIHDPHETCIIDGWYTAEEAGCASESGLCKVRPETEVLEDSTWKVLACANQECGMWSNPLNFDYSLDATEPRFTDRSDDTVTDNYSQLMWCELQSIPRRSVTTE